MTQSPNKFLSNATSTSAQRGVEAKEVEIANTCLDMDNTSASTQLRSESTRGGGEADETSERIASTINQEPGSYLQVIVEKHKSKRCRRVPVASSPREKAASAPDGIYLMPHPMLLACYKCGAEACASAVPPTVHTPGGDWKQVPIKNDDNPKKAERNDVQKSKPWKIFRSNHEVNVKDEGPDRVEVYYFERVCAEYLRTNGCERETACERAARKPARYARTAIAETAALLALLARAPIAVMLLLQRSVLELVRDAFAGCAHNISDYVFKPILAVLFNTVLHPLLVCIANVARALRDAIAPMTHLLLDVVEPLVRLLAAIRLFELHVSIPPRAP